MRPLVVMALSLAFVSDTAAIQSQVRSREAIIGGIRNGEISAVVEAEQSGDRTLVPIILSSGGWGMPGIPTSDIPFVIAVAGAFVAVRFATHGPQLRLPLLGLPFPQVVGNFAGQPIVIGAVESLLDGQVSLLKVRDRGAVELFVVRLAGTQGLRNPVRDIGRDLNALPTTAAD